MKFGKKKILLALLLLFVMGGIGVGINCYNTFTIYKNRMSEVNIGTIDVSKLKEGVYTGSFDAKLVAVTASVVVKNGKMEDIRLLKHTNGQGSSAESIVAKIVEAQSLQVDTVSGATNSSKAILKAVENALEGQPKCIR